MTSKMKVLGVLDKYTGYNFHRDSSHLLLLTLYDRNHTIYYTDPTSLFSQKGEPCAMVSEVKVTRGTPYFHFKPPFPKPLAEMDIILMRKDPPVNTSYYYATHLLSLVEDKTWVINRPSTLRDWNEKLSILFFPEWIPKTLVTGDWHRIEAFQKEREGAVVVKELDSYAGKGIHLCPFSGDHSKLIHQLTRGGDLPVMVQEYLPVERGEKRVFFIDGKTFGAIIRHPAAGGFLTSPDHGGTYAATQLTEREKKICSSLEPFFLKKGVFFAGIDLIGEYLTEINVTSPGLLWEWNEVDHQKYEEKIVDCMEKKLT
ncbi:MAG: glutathione synthase [Deltaproteobacteria bacterium]|nr:glutathione synthase [Deltaproteobacteria bacterium]